jgi:hypothetical protein
MPVASESVLEALRSVQGPELHRSLVDLGMIRNLEVDEQGTVTFTLDKAEMVGVKNIHGGVSSPTQQSYAILVQSELLHQKWGHFQSYLQLLTTKGLLS